MSADTPSEDPRWIFQNLLNAALVGNRLPCDRTILGTQTWTALNIVSSAHPDASVDDIAVACDAFEREHGRRLTTE